MIDGSQRRRIRRIAALGVGVLLAGFAVDECAEHSGDLVVL